MTARMSSSVMMRMLFVVELDLGAGVGGEDDAVALLDGERHDLPVSVLRMPVPTASTMPVLGLSLAFSGRTMPTACLVVGLVAAGRGSCRPRGRIFIRTGS